MRALDWVVLLASLVSIVAYGLYRSRGSNTVDRYLLAGKTMPWYAMALSIMATQASAITFISTTGQSYVDGMRFVQAYFGLPIAMIVICATVVPVFYRARVYTAYEYLENRFDAKTRALASIIFLCQRGLSAGLTIYAPAIVLSVILGWPERATTLLMGATVVSYTVIGGIKAVTWSDVQQMGVIFLGLLISLVTVIVLLPHSVSFGDAVFLAGAAGRLNAVTTNFDWNDRFNIWSGLIGSTFLFLSYFGCDQSQVQRYLTGRSHHRKPAQPAVQRRGQDSDAVLHPLHRRHGVRLLRVRRAAGAVPAHRARAHRAGERVSRPSQTRYHEAFEQRREAALALAQAHQRRRRRGARAQPRRLPRRAAVARRRAHRAPRAWWKRNGGEKGFSDTNYIFLSFVTRYLPAGIVGLVIAVIFAATMSASSGEINSLATVTVVDIYRRHFRRGASDHHYLTASRWATLVLGRLCGRLRRLGQEARIADRGRQRGGLAVLRLAAGLLRGGVRLPAGSAARQCSWACWRAKPPSSGRSCSATFPISGTT